MTNSRLVLLTISGVLLLAGCQGRTSRKPQLEVFPDMDRQLKFKAQTGSTLFADGRSNRRPVPGTVAQGQLKADDGYYTGEKDGMYVGKNPLEISEGLLARGQERFNVYCAPCHDRTGSGRGLVGVRSMWLANNIHDARIKEMVDGELYSVISYGRRAMPGYRFQIDERDRWAIVAYMRALQRTTSATIEDVPADLRRELR